MTTTITRKKIAKQDIGLWTGQSATTFSRPTSTGGNENVNYIDTFVDVLAVYGDNSDQNAATLLSAVAAVGSTNKRALFLAPGTWTIDTDVTIPSNVTLICPAGCNLSISTTKTLTLNTVSIDAGPYQIFTLNGTGTVAFTDGVEIKSSWFASFEIAVGAISSTKCELEITEANSIADDLTINANTTLMWTSAGKLLTVATTKTLTISTINITAGNFQIFAFTGTGAATFTGGSTLKSSWFASFEIAIDIISTVNIELEVTAADSIADDLTVPSNVWLKWGCAGRALTIANAKTLTINGGIIAPNVEIFTGSGSLAGTTLADFIQPDWSNAGLAGDTMAIGTTGIATTFIQTLMDDTTAALARATLGASADSAILGDGTSSIELRATILRIYDGVAAATIKVVWCANLASGTVQTFNRGTQVTSNGFGKSGTDSGFSLNADGSQLSISSSVLEDSQSWGGFIGTCITQNESGVRLIVNPVANSASNLTLAFLDGNNCDGTIEDLTTRVDTGDIYVCIFYITTP